MNFEYNLANNTGSVSEFYGGSVFLTNQSAGEFVIEDSLIKDNFATETFSYGTSLSGTVCVKNYKVENFTIQNTSISRIKVQMPHGVSFHYGRVSYISPLIPIKLFNCTVANNMANATNQAAFLMIRVPLQSGRVSLILIDSNVSKNEAPDTFGGAIRLDVIPNSNVKASLTLDLEIRKTVFYENNLSHFF